MGLLQRLGHEFAFRNLQQRAVPAEHIVTPHPGNNGERLAKFIARGVRIHAESLKFLAAGLCQAHFEAAVTQDIQHRAALRYPPWAVDAKWREHAGVADAQAIGSHRDRRQQKLWRRAMAEFRRTVMLNLPPGREPGALSGARLIDSIENQ